MASKTEDNLRELFGCFGLIMLIASVIGLIVFWLSEPGPLVWTLRIGLIVPTVAGIYILYQWNNRKDEVFDYLREISKGKHFDCDGFAFAPMITKRDGAAFIEILFQNQRQSSCTGRVMLVPLEGLFQGYRLEAIAFEIPCAAGVFGVARMPIPAPAKSQGHTHTWNVGAAVKFPEGRGGLLRFGQGLTVGGVADQAWDNAIMIAGLLTLLPILSSPARVRLTIPEGVLEDPVENLAPHIETLQQPQV